MIRIESQGTRQSAKSWYDKEFADWKIYKDWNQLPIMAMPGDGEWKVWIRQNVCCLVSLHDDRGGRTGVFQAFDQEEELQEFLAAIPQEQAKRETCSRNLQAIQSAKGSAQRNLKLDPEAAPDATQLARFIPGGFEKLVCPNGGKYDIGTLRKPARCSIHGTQAAIGRRR